MNKIFSLALFNLFFSIALASDKKIFDRSERSRSPQKIKKDDLKEIFKKSEKEDGLKTPEAKKMTEADKKRLLMAPFKKKCFKEAKFKN